MTTHKPPTGERPVQRRRFLHTTLAGAAAWAGYPSPARAADPTATAAEQAHAEIWRRFIDRHGVMLDFAGLDGTVSLPTPDECRAGKPNALGWFQPIENGAMFNGLYLEAAVHRWQRTRLPADADKARRLTDGLLLLSSVSDVPGFVGRGVSTDGRSHFPMGSDDQTLPWYLGLWQYLGSGLATAAERDRITRKLVDTTAALVALGWRMPAEPPFGTRGTFLGFHFDHVVRHLFVLKFLHTLTGEAKWQTQYRQALDERGTAGKDEPARSKRELCERGMRFWYAATHNWTSGGSVAALRGLWEMEDDPPLKAAYARGLAASAELAAASLSLAERFDPADASAFDPDWRAAMMPLWKPQRTEEEAVALANRQWREVVKRSPRRGREAAFVREPAAAAWVVTLCPDPAVVARHRTGVERVITRYEYTKLYCSTFFWTEMAWWRLQRLA